MDFKSPEEIKAMADSELIAYNQSLMATKDEITQEQLMVKGELNLRATLAKVGDLSPEQKAALAEHLAG